MVCNKLERILRSVEFARFSKSIVHYWLTESPYALFHCAVNALYGAYNTSLR